MNETAHHPTCENHVETKLRGFARSIMTSKLNPRHRTLRYTLAFGLPMALIWTVAASYAAFWPESYTSRMTLILPAASSQSSVALDDIGQTSTSAGSPFALRAMNPNVVYKTIAQSDLLRARVARRLGVPVGEVRKPYIKLVEETSMMDVHVSARSPEEARRRADTLLDALKDQLNSLRQDEVARRAKAIEDSLAPVRENLQRSRASLASFHRDNGLVSLEQFTAQTQSLENLERKLTFTRAEFESVASERQRIAGSLGLTREMAALALRLQANPRFAALLKEHSEATAEHATRRRQWGKMHPQVRMASARVAASASALQQLSGVSTGAEGPVVFELLHLGLGSDRSELFRKFVELDARAQGLETSVNTLLSERNRLKAKVESQSALAARLEDLERDHKIAEAVFSSALARLDTGRQDIYASYPLVQLMAQPSLPIKPSSPRILYAIAGVVIASLFLFVAAVLTWFRQSFARAI